MPGAARDIAINRYGVVWMVSATASGQVRCQLAGCTNSVLNADNVPGVSTVKCQPSVCDGSLFFWTGSAWKQFSGTANRIAVNFDNDPWVVSTSGDISHYVPPQKPILQFPTPTPAPGVWLPVPFPESAKIIAIPARAPSNDLSDQKASDQKAWAIGTDGKLFKSNEQSGQWDIVSGPVAVAVAVAASPLGGAWVVSSNGDLYELPSWADM
jgi:hypothetical protein